MRTEPTVSRVGAHWYVVDGANRDHILTGPMTEYEARSPAAMMRVEQTLRELVAN